MYIFNIQASAHCRHCPSGQRRVASPSVPGLDDPALCLRQDFLPRGVGAGNQCPAFEGLGRNVCDGLCDLRLREERLPLGAGSQFSGSWGDFYLGRQGGVPPAFQGMFHCQAPARPPPRPQPRPRLSVRPGIVRRGPAWPLGCVCPPGEKSLRAPTESHLLETALERR